MDVKLNYGDSKINFGEKNMMSVILADTLR